MIRSAFTARPGYFRLAYKFRSGATRKNAGIRARAQAWSPLERFPMPIKGFGRAVVVVR
jgi:hypothetical protein